MWKLFYRLLVFLFPFVFLFPSLTKASHIPPPTGFVNDFAQVLTSGQKSVLESSLKDYEQKTGNEIAITFVKSLEGGDITDFTVRVFEEWKIGKKGQDNGILFLAAISDRKMRIEVGYGLEPYLTDGEAGEIIRNVVAPEFKKENYYEGVVKGIEAIEKNINNQPTVTNNNPIPVILNLTDFLKGLAVITLLVMTPALIIWSFIKKRLKNSNALERNKYKKPKSVFMQVWLWGAFVLFGIFLFDFLIKMLGLLIYEPKGFFNLAVVLGIWLFIIYLMSFLARTKEFWLGGLIGGAVGLVAGLYWGGIVETITLFILLGGAGLFFDFLLSKNYRIRKGLEKPTGFWASWGGFRGGGGGGFGGGGSGGGGASGGW